ncbi:accessory factor associated with RNA polymerase II [Pleurotus pulmonarius]|nr:accessory factor associated with RNA polymerase II [Pleurotus pulmonarius]
MVPTIALLPALISSKRRDRDSSRNMSDCLLALRQAIKAKTAVTFTKDGESTTSVSAATHIHIPPNYSFPKDTPTRYRKPDSKSSDPSANPQDFYPLVAIYVAWMLKDLTGSEYMKQCREHGLSLGYISITERKAVIDWLDGKDTHPERFAPLSDANSSPSKRKYVPDTVDTEAVKKIKQNEIELQDRNSVLRGIKPNNFSNIRASYADKLKKMKDAGKGGASGLPAAGQSSADPKMAARKARNMYPIIMISSSPTALITMYNVKKFLQESVFEASQDARSRAAAEGNPRPEDMIPIYRKRTHIDSSGKETEHHARYFVVDSTEALAKFGADAWDRVVCVMTTGQAWQFRPYKWNDPRQLFHHVKGFYVSWSNDPANTKIKDWNVTELKIDPHRRHVDKAIVAHFWKTLDSWTLQHKPWLIKS